MTAPNTSGFAGGIPEKYERYLGPLLFEPYAIDLASRIDSAHTQVVLEIACGTGRLTRQLKKMLKPSARLVASDLNPDMIGVARLRVGDENIDWQTADAQFLPFPDSQFDIVICQFGVMFFPDKSKAFAEIFRVLKGGGVFLFNTWDAIENNAFFDIATDVVDSFLDQPTVFYRVPFSMYDVNELRLLCTNAGFRNVQIELVKKEGISPSAEDVAHGLIEGNPIYNEIAADGEKKVKMVIDALETAVAAKYGDRPAKGDLRAFVCRAEKGII